MCIKALKKDAIKSLLNKALHTWILEAVFGSRNDFIVFHNILKPWPALIIYIRHNVCNNIQNALDIQQWAKINIMSILLKLVKLYMEIFHWKSFRCWNEICQNPQHCYLPLGSYHHRSSAVVRLIPSQILRSSWNPSFT